MKNIRNILKERKCLMKKKIDKAKKNQMKVRNGNPLVK